MLQNTISSGATKSQNHRYGEQASVSEDLTLLNFELSKDIS